MDQTNNKIMNGSADQTTTATAAGAQSCGIDSSCPVSVTTALDKSVKLDQYQMMGSFSSPFASTKKKNKMKKKIQRKNILDEFEWYDLDVIRENTGVVIASREYNSIFHDPNAGLIFTTEEQLHDKIANVNHKTAVDTKLYTDNNDSSTNNSDNKSDSR